MLESLLIETTHTVLSKDNTYRNFSHSAMGYILVDKATKRCKFKIQKAQISSYVFQNVSIGIFG